MDKTFLKYDPTKKAGYEISNVKAECTTKLKEWDSVKIETNEFKFT